MDEKSTITMQLLGTLIEARNYEEIKAALRAATDADEVQKRYVETICRIAENHR